ncbi:MAG: FMN-binding protein [Clostridia bacterium]|nr:FMN-binding protein [Clostridia bacterium]
MQNLSFWMRVLLVVILVAEVAVYQSFVGDTYETVPAVGSEGTVVTEETTVPQDTTVPRETTTAQETTTEAARGPYKDGTYEGQGEGFRGPLTVRVTVEQGYIADVTVLSHAYEDRGYYERAETLIPSIIATQSTDGVDTVSGATYTSYGILSAVDDALSEAM